MRTLRAVRSVSPFVPSARDRARLVRFALAWTPRSRRPRTVRFTLRTGAEVVVANRSELIALREVFAEEEYALELRAPARAILDCGANVGFASHYFAERHPEAQIVAVEADPTTFERLASNVAGHDRITPVHAALSDADGTATFYSAATSMSSSLTRRDAGQQEVSVPAITLSTLLRETGIDRVDVLKLDIEGAEFDVLAAAQDELGRVGVVAAEIHYDLGSADEAAVRGWLHDFDCRFTPLGRPGRFMLLATRRPHGETGASTPGPAS